MGHRSWGPCCRLGIFSVPGIQGEMTRLHKGFRREEQPVGLGYDFALRPELGFYLRMGEADRTASVAALRWEQAWKM